MRRFWLGLGQSKGQVELVRVSDQGQVRVRVGFKVRSHLKGRN